MFYLTNERYKEMTQRAYGKKDDEVSPLSYMNSDEISTYTTPQQKEQQGVLADTADAFQMGMGRGASDLSRLVAIGANKLGWNNVESWFNKAADMAAEYADEQVTQMSDEMREALNQDVTEDPSALTNIRWWAGNLGSVLGSELDTVIVSAVTLGAGSAAYAGAKTAAKQGAKYVLKKELAEKVGQVAFKEAVKRGASNKFAQIAALDAVQSAMMAGSRANQTREDMLRLSDEELANNDKFIQEYSAISNSEDGQLMTGNERFEAAKNNFIAKASRDAAFDPKAMLSDLATNAISGLGGGFMGLGKAAKTKTGGFLKGAFKESATEAIQGATEQYAINETAKEYYDPDRDLMENVASNAVQSAILGAGFGGPTGVLDVYSERRAFNKAKKQLLNFKSTGNETVDQSLRSYVDMVNQQANDLDDLITQSRFNAHYAMAQREARAANIMADLNQSTNQPDLSQSPTQDAVNTFTQNHKPIQTSAITENQLGGTDEIDIGNGNYQPISYAVVDVANLTPTQNKADNQFRDRNRVASLSQINEIARNLDPRKLSASPTMDVGAPLLAQDGSTVIAGNGRTMALQQAYQQGLADNYRQYLLSNADQFGLSQEKINQFRNPVLVRRLDTPVDITQTAINSNEQGGMRMSNLEQAKVDSQRLPNLDAFYISETGDLNTSDNQNFVRQFILNQPANLRNELLDSKGNLSQTGTQRLRNAVLFKAYGDTETLSRAIESTDQGSRNIINALTRIAPIVARVKQDIANGNLINVDISNDIVSAVEKYNQLKQQNQNIDEYLKQQDFVSDLSSESKALLKIFDENARSAKRITQVLNNYYQSAQKQGNTAQTNMFGEVMFDKESALEQASKNQDDDLFDDVRRSVNAPDLEDIPNLENARKLGFNTDYYYRHGTYEQNPISRIDPDESFGALFTLQNQFGDQRPSEASVGDTYQDFVIKGEPLTHQEFNEKLYEDTEKSKDLISRVGYFDKDSLTDEQWDNLFDLVTEDSDVYDFIDDEGNLPDYLKETLYTDNPGEAGWEVQKLRIKLAKEFGANAVNIHDEYGSSVALLPGNGVRNIQANFDPEQADSDGLMFSRSAANTSNEFEETAQKYGGKEAYDKAVEDGDTELSYQQWVQVRTPSFKAWFGDWENDPKKASKAINPRTGEPLVVYHGSNNYEETRKWNDKQKYYETEYQPFNIFKRNVDGLENQGHFFNSDKDNAFGYGVNEYHTYLNLKNPLIIDAKSSHYSAIKHKRNIKDTYDWAKYAENKGYDGVIFENVRDGADFSALDKDTNNFVAFAANQIKSATDNVGTFDSDNDDIRYSKRKSDLDNDYLALAKRYQQGDHSVEPQLREMVNQAATEKGFGKPDYRMSHEAPNRYDEISRSIDDLSEIYPEDLYSSQGYHYYGSGYGDMDKAAWRILKRVKGNPEAEVTIYRAYPKGTGGTITNGDWVTIVRDYAVEHGEANLDGDYEIASKKVKAKDVFTNGDSLQEQGYDNGLSEVVNSKKKIKLDELICRRSNLI